MDASPRPPRALEAAAPARDRTRALADAITRASLLDASSSTVLPLLSAGGSCIGFKRLGKGARSGERWTGEVPDGDAWSRCPTSLEEAWRGVQGSGREGWDVYMRLCGERELREILPTFLCTHKYTAVHNGGYSPKTFKAYIQGQAAILSKG